MKKKQSQKKPERIERVKKKLYDPKWRSSDADIRPVFYSRGRDVAREWGKKEKKKVAPVSKKKNSLIKGVFGVSVVFFIISVGLAAYMLSGGGVTISSDRVDIAFEGPVSVSGGDDMDIIVSITNNNSQILEQSNIVITYPPGFYVRDNVTGDELTREYRSLGSIAPGETKEELIQGVVFGSEDEEKTVSIAMEYRVPRSNATFIKEALHAIRIDSAPIGITLSTLDEVNNGQEVDIGVEIASNTDVLLEDVAVILEYPFGFEPVAADPEPSQGNNVWYVGDIPSGEDASILIRGVVRGEHNDERTVRARVGMIDSAKTTEELSVVYNESKTTIAVRDFFLGVQLALDGEVKDTYVVAPEKTVRGTLSYRNNTTVPLRNVVIELVFSGSVIDKYAVDASDGFYDSRKGTILWSADTFDELEEIEPGESGTFTFDFASKMLVDVSGTSIRNPETALSVNVRGIREAEGDVMESHSGAIVRTVRVYSDMRIATRGLYSTGPFANTGPMPPKAEEETTYTIALSVVNSSNDLRNTTISGILPIGVEWKGVIDPSYADITYNATNRTVTWTIGSLEAGAGVETAGPEAMFQVGLTPSITQVGSRPVLFSDIVMSAYDAFTDTNISTSHADITTDLRSDPNIGADDAAVRE
ncbi:MAG: hypothetical protein H8D63_00720 [Parcubacteria group bacterium]|nr:hypothetical protein [Parcubacteria group bacterium]